MTIALITVTTLLATLFIIVPIIKYQSRQDAQAFEDAYRAFKLRTVLRHYPFLGGMAAWEVEKHYDLELLFQNVR